ncbi:oxidoreductase [Mytilinidion resinicola]|uniref:Oxidoreductase n=1 Tax=Mytilinidion resinicola TaxID=574789 RepID=A0A6A6YIK3_9PEZI|nr:oxidoreductase [Mytilinidion resinicola]KAF2807824.1 oxidoreductase [Mytilinidion resinicola]
MAPIRIGFIGLSAGRSWAAWAHITYLKDTSKYTIVALCNTSVEAAQAAINAHGLPETTKAYDSPQALADDPNVELVVCSVKVPYHYATIMPSLKAGKDIFCEWPLAKDVAEAEELISVAKSKGVRTMVGLQACRSPFVHKVKELVESGKIGKVLSVTFVGNSGFGGLKEPDFAEYTNYRENGANVLTIYSMHAMEAILYSLGEISSFSSIIETKRPKVEIVDGKGAVVKTITRTTHDQILLQGHLESGALLSYHMRGGPAFAGNEGLIWRIYGETGEIQVTASGTYLQAGHEDMTIRLQDHATGETTKIEPNEDDLSKLPLFTQNVGRVYEAFADKKTDGYMDWSYALLRHKLVDEIYKRDAAGKQETPATYTKA